jgi:ABC-type dipeptide/oligopeptide/nickel transport system permease component
MKINLDHFEVSVLFALLASIMLGLVTKRTQQERVRYGLYCFSCFMAALFGIGWAMHFLHG